MIEFKINELNFIIEEEVFVEFGYDGEKTMGDYDYYFSGVEVWIILNGKIAKARKYSDENKLIFSFLVDVENFFKTNSTRKAFFEFIKSRYSVESVKYFSMNGQEQVE